MSEQETAARESAYRADCSPCACCGCPAYRGQCESIECMQADLEDSLRERIEPDAWQADEDGDPGCHHSWLEELEVDLDVVAIRTCVKCRRRESQTIAVSPEPPNCYVPGDGWRVV